jgi:hypothetical protein
MDLVIAGAIIKDYSMIEKCIESLPDYDFNNKFILFDGYSGFGGDKEPFLSQYNAYKEYIAKKYPDFLVISFDENIYFRDMIEKICEISNAERLFVIQDDVIAHKMDLKQIEIQMNYIEDLKILCFPHKYIPPEGTHWYEPFDDTYPLPFIKSHGFSERIFICDRLNMINICNDSPKNNKMEKRFIEFIYQTTMKRRIWKVGSDKEKEIYWKKFGSYFHHDITHTHQCGKRRI